MTGLQNQIVQNNNIVLKSDMCTRTRDIEQVSLKNITQEEDLHAKKRLALTSVTLLISILNCQV